MLYEVITEIRRAKVAHIGLPLAGEGRIGKAGGLGALEPVGVNAVNLGAWQGTRNNFV